VSIGHGHQAGLGCRRAPREAGRVRAGAGWRWGSWSELEALHPIEDRRGGRREDLIDDASVDEEEHPVGVRRRDRVVGDHHDALPEVVDGVPQERQDLHAGSGVEVAGGLVGEADRRSAHQGAGAAHPLLLPAGELVWAAGSGGPGSQHVNDGVEPRDVELHARDVDGQGDVLACCESRSTPCP
jgi:hypothetical protein